VPGSLRGADQVPPPQLVICSSAVRTRQTAALVVQAMGQDLPIDSFDALYGAQPDLVLQYVREVDEEVASVLVVGHNPTVYQLAWQLLVERQADGGDGDDRARLEAQGFPTCALALLRLEVASWEDVTDGCASLTTVRTPPY